MQADSYLQSVRQQIAADNPRIDVAATLLDTPIVGSPVVHAEALAAAACLCSPTPVDAAHSTEVPMHALVWAGVAFLALSLLGWLVFKITLWLAGMFFLLGLALVIWGAVKTKRAV